MKTFIKNRDENEICVVVQESKKGKLAFVMHGLSGNKEELHLGVMIDALKADSYTVVVWDAVHTFGESKGGKYEDATITNYYADLEDVIKWASEQEWFAKPFLLAGHSLGGIGVGLYAEQHPNDVLALAPISTVVNGDFRMESKARLVEDWKRTGWLTEPRSAGGSKGLKWGHMEDNMQYDLIKGAAQLTMPVLMVVGSEDTSTWPKHQQALFDVLPEPKELHIIKGANHVFSNEHERDELRHIFEAWLNTLKSSE